MDASQETGLVGRSNLPTVETGQPRHIYELLQVQASLEFRGFDIRGFEFSRFMISPKLLA